MYFEKWFPVDLLKLPNHVLDVGMPLFVGDNDAIRIGVTVQRGGEDENVTGSVKGYVILPNGVMVAPFDGDKEGNKAWLDLPDDALCLSGRIQVAIRVFDGEAVTTLLATTASVRRAGADEVFDPSDIVPTWDDVLTKIAEMDQAYEACIGAATGTNAVREMETDAEEGDLDITDGSGNVLTRFGGGHIQTKNFDSADVLSRLAALELPWTGKKWAAIGDSLTEVNSRTTMHYHDYIAEKTGISVVNLGMSGTGYKRDYSSSALAFYKRIDAVPTDSDIVTIFGGGNDTGKGYTLGDITDSGTTTICGCINATIDAIQQRITTVQLGIITPTPWVGQTPEDAGSELAAVSEAIVEICRRRSIPCLDLYHCSNLRPNDATFRAAAYSKDSGFDGVHPDETGHLLIAGRFFSFLRGLIL